VALAGAGLLAAGNTRGAGMMVVEGNPMKASTKPATSAGASPRYTIAHMAEIAPTPCPCGQARRAFTDDPQQIASLHITEIKADSQVHYHKKMTELYYVLEGTGTMELDGQSHPIKPGDAIMIKPGCRHRAVGNLKVLIVPVPAFDESDEWFDLP
jgi:mannose-6-phosphate isomerase-like protein (cupin superfamily)